MLPEDCYAVLNISENATPAEIKHAFRLKAKSLHPDLTGRNGDADAMRKVLQAYKILSNENRRAEFDALFSKFKAAEQRAAEGLDDFFNYRIWLSHRTDPESRARLIFFDLLHDRENDAVAEYHACCDKDCTFSLETFFDREDFMDCGFILAEELFFRNDFYASFVILNRVMRLELEKPYFRHFYPEVVILMREIIRNRLQGTIGDDLLIDCLEAALELHLGKKDDAFCFRRMAESFERIGDVRSAALCLRESLRLDPDASGMTAIKKRLEGKYI